MLAVGTKLGHYEILGLLGAGGMGAVYRARDTRLGREVAVKVLPEDLAADPELRRRFDREARAISALNHPHICVLHDVGLHNGLDYLVMECLDGETLAHRLERGALPTEQVLRYGAEIADALDRAHRSGIVHRDLKPGNIMLTKSGAKLMDFGLARRTQGRSDSHAGSANVPQFPTRSLTLTGEGVLVGTFPYMAPEQLQGREADTRTDIFALGATLYEMATGRRAFAAENQASLIAAILAEEPPPLAELQPSSPPGLDRVVHRCLSKDPEERWQNARDVMLELRWVRNAGLAGVPEAQAARERRRVRWVWALATVGILSVLALLVLTRTRFEGLPIQAALNPPPGAEFSFAGDVPILAITQDGSRFAFCARLGEGPAMLWVRSLDRDDAKPLADTEGAFMPFFSPDGGSLGFFAGGKLKRVDVAGGPAIALADAPEARGGAWSAKGVILYQPHWIGPILVIPAGGGRPVAATTLDTGRTETMHRYPCPLPDGRHFLYLSRTPLPGGDEEPSIWAGDLESPRRTRVLRIASNVAFASGHVLFVRQGALVARRFDARRLVAQGPEVPLVENVRVDERRSYGQFAASQNGVLVYLTGKGEPRKQLRWVNRDGTRGDPVGEPADYSGTGGPTISPDGSQATVLIKNQERAIAGIWLMDLASGRRRRLTIDDDDHSACAWSADGRQVVFNAVARSGALALIRRPVEGSAAGETLFTREQTYWQPGTWSPDGQFILGLEEENIGRIEGLDIMSLPVRGPRALRMFAGGRGHQRSPHFSSDGRFVAYASDESGRDEIYVASFPQPGPKWQVSTEGGVEPRWSREGSELFYFDLENWLVAVEVKTSPAGLRTGGSRRLFQLHSPGDLRRYDVAGNGARFLVSTPVKQESSAPIVLVTNWTAKLRRR